MTAIRPAKKKAPLPEDVLKDLRDHARTYFKLDLTYIAAIGAALTILRFERPAMFEAIAAFGNYANALLLLILFDTFAAAWLSDQWIAVRCGSGEQTRPLFSRALATVQPLAHAIFVISILLFVVARSQGFYSMIWISRAEADLQDRVERFDVISKRYPTSFEELKGADPDIPSIVERLSGEGFSYEAVGERDYRLTFNRRARGWRVDAVATHEFQLRPILDEVEKTTPLP